jgi:nucleosome binding factor SPN SPT16 subunit
MTIYRKSSDQLSKTTNLVTVDTDKIYVAEINKFVGKNVVLINAEKIFYNSVDIANSCITGLIRGVSTTGVIPVHPINSTIEVLAKFNIVPKSRYNLSWNTMIDPVMGDPLQASDTLTANFLT